MAVCLGLLAGCVSDNAPGADSNPGGGAPGDPSTVGVTSQSIGYAQGRVAAGEAAHETQVRAWGIEEGGILLALSEAVMA